jgi:hypothetical protein
VIDLYWLPLGAGGWFVRRVGRLYDSRHPLYHAALEVRSRQRYVIEVAPAWNERERDRGVVATGPVGIAPAGRLKLFRYEIRCWRDGRIPDVAEAVATHRLSDDAAAAQALIERVPHVPIRTWTPNWNSNSVIAWLLTRGGFSASPPQPGRAPGWDAGVHAAAASTRT